MPYTLLISCIEAVCLFSDPITYLYNIVLLIYAFYVRKDIDTKLNNFALLFVISNLEHDEIIRVFYLLTTCGILVEMCDGIKLQFAV